MVLLTVSSDGRKHSWKGGGEAPFINSLFILNLLISCCFCSLTKRSRDTAAFHPSARGERGREQVWEGRERERGDMISNSAETAIDCRERESVSDYLAAGMFSCSCVSLGEAAALQNTPPRVRCTTKASVMSAFVYRGMFLLISCVFNSVFQSCSPGLYCIPQQYHKSNPGSVIDPGGIWRHFLFCFLIWGANLWNSAEHGKMCQRELRYTAL